MQSVVEIKTGSDVRCLGVYIDGDEPVLVPLLTELPRARFRSITKALAAINDGTSDDDADEIIDGFFAEYLGKEVVDAMKQSEYTALVKAWTEASQDEAGASVGES
jgi:hypothetical protein